MARGTREGTAVYTFDLISEFHMRTGHKGAWDERRYRSKYIRFDLRVSDEKEPKGRVAREKVQQ